MGLFAMRSELALGRAGEEEAEEEEGVGETPELLGGAELAPELNAHMPER